MIDRTDRRLTRESTLNWRDAWLRTKHHRQDKRSLQGDET